MNEQHEAATVAAMHEQHADSGDYTWHGPRMDGTFVSYADLAAMRADLERVEALLVAAQAEDAAKDAKIARLRADLDLCLGYLDAVLDGMTVQELAALADVADEVRARCGLREVRG